VPSSHLSQFRCSSRAKGMVHGSTSFLRQGGDRPRMEKRTRFANACRSCKGCVGPAPAKLSAIGSTATVLGQGGDQLPQVVRPRYEGPVTSKRPRLVARHSSHMSRVALLFAGELGVDVEFSPVLDLMSTDRDDFGGNPSLKVPSLVRGDSRVFGALNVCRWLAKTSESEARIPHAPWPFATSSRSAPPREKRPTTSTAERGET